MFGGEGDREHSEAGEVGGGGGELEFVIVRDSSGWTPEEHGGKGNRAEGYEQARSDRSPA
jgi:hypothetical protein